MLLNFFKKATSYHPVFFALPFVSIVFSQAETWQRIHLYDNPARDWSMGEQATVGDFNHDGKMDVASSIWWWEGPNFTVKHAFSNRKGTALYPYDFNGDGWMDLIMYSDQGGEGYIYINPKNNNLWAETQVLEKTDGENPDFIDINGDGKPEAFVYENRMLGYYQADWSNPLKPWKFVSITPYIKTKVKWSHGYGFGDLNKDGRPDILESNGWWENPTTPGPIWKFHPYQFGYRNGIKYFPFEDFFLQGCAHMYVYDVNDDGKPDVISSVDAHGWGLAWYEQLDTKLADGSPDFRKHMIINTRKEFEAGLYPRAFSQMHSILLRDMNEDGLLDIVTGKRKWAHGTQGIGGDTSQPENDPEPAAPGVVYWFELKRTGSQVSYIPHQMDDNSGVGTQFQVADIDGDGHLDFVEGNNDGGNILIQKAPFPIKTSLIRESMPRWGSGYLHGIQFFETTTRLNLTEQGSYKIDISDLSGKNVKRTTGNGQAEFKISDGQKPGVYTLHVQTARATLNRKVTILPQ